MMFAFSRDRAVPGHQLWRKVSRNRVPYYAVIAIGVLAVGTDDPDVLEHRDRLLVGTSIAVIGLYIAFILPVILRFRQGDKFQHGAWSLGKQLQVDRPDLDHLGRLHLRSCSSSAAVHGGHPVAGRLQLGRRELRAADGRRRAHPLRRLVAALRQELVQGPRPDGHRRGARAAGGAGVVGLRGSRRHAVRDSVETHRLGSRGEAAPPRPDPSCGYPTQAPPFWSIAWPVTPRASGESSQATVPAMSSG